MEYINVFLSLVILTTFWSGCDVRARSINHNLTEATIRPRPVTDHFVIVDRLRIHYIECGTGPTVVMIHGNAGSVEDFEFGALDLLASNYRVVAIDRPGHGGSDRPSRKATVEFQAELLQRTLSQLGINEPILVGHSWGASLALAYALQYPGNVSAIVLLAPAAYPDSGEDRLLRATSKIPLIGDLGLVLGRPVIGHRMVRAGLARAFYPQSPSDRYLKLADSLWLRRKQLKAYVEDEASLNDSLRKMAKRYAEIKIPVVIVTGDRDQIVSPDQNARVLHTAIPDSQLIEVPNTGHEIPQTSPRSVQTALGMIARVSPAGCGD
jgi:pimeloyl-ACP methyl ester carboxylesterase